MPSLVSLENNKINGSYCKDKQALGSSTNLQKKVKKCEMSILRGNVTSFGKYTFPLQVESNARYL